MATYNGEKYLRDQIDSILSQEGVNLRLVITDDHSEDKSFFIASEYASTDKRVHVCRNEHNIGVAANFMNMVANVDPDQFDYVAFSDQDDVWFPEKLSTAADIIENKCSSLSAKRLKGIGTPVLYSSDLLNVNEALENPVRELQGLDIDLSCRATPLLKNYFSGCTMVMNSSMVRLLQEFKALEFPRIHDAWCSMVAFYCGNLVFDSANALIFRRISGNNAIGAITAGRDLRDASLKNVMSPPRRSCSRSARLLLDNYAWALEVADLDLIASFVDYPDRLRHRLKWAVSTSYRAVTFRETLLLRLKILLGRL